MKLCLLAVCMGLIIPRLTPPARLCIRQHMPFFQISHVYQGVDMCKSKKRACAVVYTYVVLVNGKLPKTLLWIMFFILFLQPISHHLYSCADVGLFKASKKRQVWHRYINAYFGLKTVFNQKGINLGMISAMHTSNRQTLKKVTCPFKGTSSCV